MRFVYCIVMEDGYYMDKEKFLELVIELLPDPIFAIDKDGKIILWNRALENLTKVKKEEVLGKGNFTHSEIFYGYKRPTLADLVLKPDEEVERKSYTNFKRYADGSVEGETYSAKLDYYNWAKAVPIYNENGDIEVVVSISRDISENIKYQKQRDILLKRYETLFVNSPDGIACFNKEHIIFDVNESFLKIFGYTREECIGKNLDDLVVPKRLREEAVQKTNELFEKGIVDTEAIRYTKTGDPIVVNIRATLMKIDDEILGGYGIYTDVTEKVKYKEELESTNMELEATIEQLMSNEEELRAQYDEIQKYSEMNEELKQKYEIAIEATDCFIWEIIINKGIMNFSKNFADLVGVDIIRKENPYEIIEEIVHEEDRDKLINELTKYKSGLTDEIETQIRIIDKNKKIHWYLARGKGIKNREGEITTLHGVLIDITKIKQQEEFIKYLAEHDSLTGLYNRRKFREILDNELANNRKGALFLLDIDDFKNINDILGHVYGDELLKRFAKVLKDMVNENIIAFRFGGDEFLILLKEEELKHIVSFADKVLNAFKERIVVDYLESNLTVSMGIVRFPYDGNTIDELLIKADIAMYNAKKAGKNRYFLFDKQMKLNFNYKINIENMLRKALKNEAFLLLYQPIVETNTGKVSSLEALLRLRDNNIGPEKFIPIAEETGLILPIGKWVIKEVVKQISIWAKGGCSCLPVAINLSPRQFYDAALIDYMKKVLDEYRVDPSLLEIEITENVFAEKRHETINILNRLKNLGVKISLDDFGTGYSSLNYLTYMPIDKIKLDKKLKDRFIEDTKIMDSLIVLLHGLNMKVVTEGVEEIEDYRRMKKAGSDYVQGYLFSKPVKQEEVEKIVNMNYGEILCE